MIFYRGIVRRLLVLFVVTMPIVLNGCPVCGFGQDGSRMAFIVTTALLTFTPLVLIGFIVLFLRRCFLVDEGNARKSSS